MARILLLFCCLVISSRTFAQVLEGEFSNGKGEYVLFKANNQVEFVLWRLGGIHYRVTGAGTYKPGKPGDLLVTFQYGYVRDRTKVRYTVTQGGSDRNIHIYTKDTAGQPYCCPFFSYKRKGRARYGQLTTETLRLEEMPDDSVLTISMGEYEDCRIRLPATANLTYTLFVDQPPLSYLDINRYNMTINYRLDQDTLRCGFDGKYGNTLIRKK